MPKKLLDFLKEIIVESPWDYSMPLPAGKTYGDDDLLQQFGVDYSSGNVTKGEIIKVNSMLGGFDPNDVDINSYGWTVGTYPSCVGNKVICPGGSFGDWDGTLPLVLKIAKMANITPGSQKRWTVNTASSNISNHWCGLPYQYAADLPTYGKKGDEAFLRIKNSLLDLGWLKKTDPDYNRWENNVGTYPYFIYDNYKCQVLWYSDADHKDHIHVGCKNLSPAHLIKSDNCLYSTVDLSGDREQIKKNKQESQKNSQRPLYDSLPKKVRDAIDLLKKDYGVEITEDHLRDEIDQENATVEEVSGLDSNAKTKMDELIRDCKKANPNVSYPDDIVSDYRSYIDQVKNFGGKVKSGRSIENVQKSNAIPGFSQHHTGKAFDIFSTEESWWDSNPKVKTWVSDNASKYGFDVTYKTDGSLRVAEPWHLFYVGNTLLDDEKSSNLPSGESKTITKSTYIIQLGNPSSKEFNVIWGGTPSSKYGVSFMKTQGDSYLSGKNIIYSDWENSISTLKDKLKEELGDGYSIRSVSGFSKGAETIFKNWGSFKSYEFIGLIDPSTYGIGSAKSEISKNDSKIKSISNHTNWGCCANVKQDLKDMEESGKSIRITNPSKPYNHDDMPKTFFEKYSSSY